jgi:hypothetical protein
VIGGKFKLGRKIGSGSFGELYLGMPRRWVLESFMRFSRLLSETVSFCFVLLPFL